MNLSEDVINRITIPTKPKDKFCVQLRVAGRGALTQTYGGSATVGRTRYDHDPSVGHFGIGNTGGRHRGGVHATRPNLRFQHAMLRGLIFPTTRRSNKSVNNQSVSKLRVFGS
jgi:hypothetical protein